jgi:hypothetical protein
MTTLIGKGIIIKCYAVLIHSDCSDTVRQEGTYLYIPALLFQVEPSALP